MDKNEYFELSKKRGLPNRCPILNICERRALTVYFFSYYPESKNNYVKVLLECGEIPSDFQNIKVPFQGEAPRCSKGNTLASFHHVCPEVNLFDSGHRWGNIGQIACTIGEYDKFFEGNQTRCYETKHYSECSEFSYHQYQNSLLANGGKKRKGIPQKLRALLQKEINSSCPFCQNEDVEHFDIHHIDNNPSNNDSSNLIMICKNCHSKITKDDIEQNLVVEKKLSLQKSLK